jgi:glycosyltransferase involved in cell wall biosynthesis
MKIAKIIITEQSIPYLKNGSWTQRLEYFFKSDYNFIDYCICGETNKNLVSSTVFFTVKQYQSKVILKFFPKLRFRNYILKVQELSQKYDHLIVCVIDNIKIKNAIADYIDHKNAKQKFTLLFYSCGYSYFLEQEAQKKFLKHCDEYIFLTQKSYQFNRDLYAEFIPEVSILNNPIEKKIVHKISKIEKELLLEKHGLNGKTVFLWLSHDREKKGLEIVLNAWREWNSARQDVHLLIVGAKRDYNLKNVQFLGQINSDCVAEYYQLAHVYLFPTLWKEGFGLSLAQAICSGCYCIAANNGGVSDFLLKEDGLLIENPNKVLDWIEGMESAFAAIQSGWSNPTAGLQILDYDQWSSQFAQIFQKWEDRINK